MKAESIQSSFLSGVLDPRASSRIETDAYQQGLLTARNVIPLNLGGLRRRSGLRYVATAPFGVSRLTPSSITLPNTTAGVTADVSDDNINTHSTTTTAVGTVNPYVVVRFDMGSAVAVQFANVEKIFSDAGSSTQFQIQYSTDDAAWTTLGAAFSQVDTTPRSFMREGPITARYWRVAKIGGTNMGAVLITISDFTLWASTGVVSLGRAIPFEITTTDQYTLVLTGRIGSIYQNNALVQRVQLPYAEADLAAIDADTDAETMVLTHPDYPQRFLLRELTGVFQSFEIEFDNVPQFDFADSSSPTPADDVQAVTFLTGWVEGEVFTLGLDGAETGPIKYAGDDDAASQAATAENIRKAVQTLYVVPGFSGVSVERSGARTYRITFSAASAGAFGKMTGTALTSSAKITVFKESTGTSRSEPLWSATRGYARTVCFFGERLWFGGFKSREQTLAGSQINNILDFDTGGGLPDDAILVGLKGGKLNSIQGLFPGRTLQVFTASGEFRFIKDAGESIVPGDKPFLQSQYGSKKVRPTSIDGATVYVQATGKAIRDFRYDYQQVIYASLGLSSLAPHLINDVVDLASWNGSRIDEIGLVFVVNGDGTVAVLNSRAETKVQAWTNWDTNGLFKSVAVVRENVNFLVQRTINGEARLYLEQLDPECYTDSATLFELGSGTSLTGISHLDGVECRVRADGSVLPRVTPSSGTATITTSDDVEIGLGWSLEVTPMPLVAVTKAGPNFMTKRRVVKVHAKLRNTLGLSVNGRLLGDYVADVDSFDTAPTPFTGVRDLEESTNWDAADEKLVTLSQEDPLPFEIEAIQVTMESQ